MQLKSFHSEDNDPFVLRNQDHGVANGLATKGDRGWIIRNGTIDPVIPGYSGSSTRRVKSLTIILIK